MRANTKVYLLRIVPLIGLAFLTGCTDEGRRTVPPADIVINLNERGIGDAFSPPLLRMLQETASSGKRGIPVSFNRGKTSITFLFRDLEDWSSIGISIDTPRIYLDYDRVEIDDEILDDTEFEERLALYGKAADMTDSNAAFILSASPGVSITLLMDYLTTMSESGVNVLILESDKRNLN